MSGRFEGQWIGHADGSSPGWITLEIESRGKMLSGVAYHYPDELELNSLAVFFEFEPDQSVVDLQGLPTTPFEPHNGTVFAHDDMGVHFPDAMTSKTADLHLEFVGDEVNFRYSTPPAGEYPGSIGQGVAFKAHSRPSRTPVKVMSWEEFRAAAFTPEPNRFLFRGQTKSSWPLRTSFHRSPLKNLNRYRQEIAPNVLATIAPQLSLALDLNNPEHTGAFYNLLQHHGFPTPLLDWSHSPFIAAYFAFEGLSYDAAPEGHVRLFMFDRKAWAVLRQQHSLTFTSLHFSLLDLIPLGNPRFIPQQAFPTLTNIDDIEGYLASVSAAQGIQYLQAIDIPVADRKAALDDLALMGIHHGALFPGLDGTCRGLKYRHFGM